jgi:hypothetical protein
MKLTVPTMLTLLRMLLIPVLVLVFYLPFNWTNFAAAFVFILASVTTGSMGGSRGRTTSLPRSGLSLIQWPTS